MPRGGSSAARAGLCRLDRGRRAPILGGALAQAFSAARTVRRRAIREDLPRLVDGRLDPPLGANRIRSSGRQPDEALAQRATRPGPASPDLYRSELWAGGDCSLLVRIEAEIALPDPGHPGGDRSSAARPAATEGDGKAPRLAGPGLHPAAPSAPPRLGFRPGRRQPHGGDNGPASRTMPGWRSRRLGASPGSPGDLGAVGRVISLPPSCPPSTSSARSTSRKVDNALSQSQGDRAAPTRSSQVS